MKMFPPLNLGPTDTCVALTISYPNEFIRVSKVESDILTYISVHVMGVVKHSEDTHILTH